MTDDAARVYAALDGTTPEQVLTIGDLADDVNLPFAEITAHLTALRGEGVVARGWIRSDTGGRTRGYWQTGQPRPPATVDGQTKNAQASASGETS
mgnify:CR=1 FL=1